MYNMYYNPVRDLMLAFERNKFGKKFLHFLINIGFEDFVYRIVNKKNLNERAKFYESKRNEVEQNINLLSDELSKNIYANMIKYRVTRKRKIFPKFSVEDQYFPQDIIKIEPDEVFVDCGAFNGDTTISFKKYSDDKFKKVVCFEPDKNNYNELSNLLKEDKRIKYYNNAVDECCKKVSFFGGDGKQSLVVENETGNTEIEAVSLDSIEDCKDATFVKMDIEGLEPEALKGAMNIIKNNKPKLAICIYHSDSDMVEIMKYIYGLNPEYKFYVRQHSIYEAETVLYCI